jgi:hypothetical protein
MQVELLATGGLIACRVVDGDGHADLAGDGIAVELCRPESPRLQSFAGLLRHQGMLLRAGRLHLLHRAVCIQPHQELYRWWPAEDLDRFQVRTPLTEEERIDELLRFVPRTPTRQEGEAPQGTHKPESRARFVECQGLNPGGAAGIRCMWCGRGACEFRFGGSLGWGKCGNRDGVERRRCSGAWR